MITNYKDFGGKKEMRVKTEKEMGLQQKRTHHRRAAYIVIFIVDNLKN
jgi:hypothetical protein